MQLNQNNKLDNGKTWKICNQLTDYRLHQWKNKFEKDTFIAGQKTSPESAVTQTEYK